MLRPALVAAALIAVALSIFALLRPRAPDGAEGAAPSAGSMAGGGPGPADAGAARRGAEAGAGVGAPAAGPGGRPSPAAQAPLDAWVDPATLSADELEARRAYRLEQSRRARAAYGQYPPHSRPLRESEDLLVPEQVPPTIRPLARPAPTGAQGQVVIRQTQDRVFLRPGTAATVGLEASLDGAPVPVNVLSAVLVRAEGSPPVPSAPVQRVAFGQAAAARVASFTPPAEALAGYAGDLLLQVDAEAGGERGALVYAFVYTGEPPAAFTGRARDRLEAGSVVFEAGVDVRRPGRYRITARVDDAAGKPLALARFDGELPAGAALVPLVLFGKIARDEGGTSPFVLRDVEGFRLLDGVYPDRETMATWSGPYRSRPYRPEELSAAPWAGGAAPGATPGGP